MRLNRIWEATQTQPIGYHSPFTILFFVLVCLFMKSLRQQNKRPVISYVPRVEPAPPDHASKVEGYKDVWLLRGKYVAFILMGDRFKRSQPFSQPESAQRWAVQMRHEGEVEGQE